MAKLAESQKYTCRAAHRIGLWVCFALCLAIIPACGPENRSGLCVQEVQRRLEGQVYRFNEAEFARSEKDKGDGTLAFVGTVILKPGTSKEEKQTVSCVIQMDADGVPSRVVGFGFDWSGGTASDAMPTH